MRDTGTAHQLASDARPQEAVRGRCSGLWLRTAAASAAFLLVVACATSENARSALFRPTPPDDAFAPLIRSWQVAERVEASDERQARMRGAPGEGELASTYREFSPAVRRKIVDDVVEYVQLQSGALAPKASPAERETPFAPLLAKGEGRYDAFELLTFSLLRARGFTQGELFRAILRRGSDDAYHRVTLWFEFEDTQDPYVLDPTGWVTRDVELLSRIAPWKPVRIYDENRQYSAEPALAK